MNSSSGTGWKLRGNSEVKPGVASFPEQVGQPLETPATKFALLKAKNKAVSLAVEIRESAAGNVIFVYPGTLGAATGVDVDCVVEAKTDCQHRLYLLFCTQQGILSLIGLLLGVTGIVIDGSLKIGAAMMQPLIEMTSSDHALLLVLATILQVVGIGIVFARTFRRSDF